MVEDHDHTAPRAIGHVLAKLSRIGIDNAKCHIGQMPFARAATIFWQLDLIEITLPLTLKFLINGMTTVLFYALAAGPMTDVFASSGAIHHPHGFGFQFLGQFHVHGYFFAVRRRRQAVILTATTEAEKQCE
ncbi:hypothetical protein PS685_05339 [Pseudomonas fluorescens]|uniref:Uncharacterized protein n=1 Tax=Pseudomonas fluorescens TaxID=294 RepID=A0A5E7AE19_PSEFL|nr:hypothetical protein PS685_05339 [Pseudomonas fluorescens]